MTENFNWPIKVANWLLTKALPYRDITKTLADGSRSLYLRRFFLVRTGRIKIFVHIIARSDEDDASHDHPWSFASLILWGRYVEETPDAHVCGQRNLGIRGWLSGAWRPWHSTVHRVLLEPGRQVLTLVVAGPRAQDWGFVLDSGKKVPWRQYLGLPPAATSEPEDL